MTSTGVVLAAGEGNRFNSQSRKQFTELRSKPVLQYSLELFDSFDAIDDIVVVGPPDDLRPTRTLVNTISSSTPTTVIGGGTTRFDSVKRGLSEVPDRSPEKVFLHDAARPGASTELCRNLLDRLSNNNDISGVIPVIKIPDTVKRVAGDHVESTLDRNSLRRAQTPQLYRRETLQQSVESWRHDQSPTDEAQLLENAGYSVGTVAGDLRCRKLTYPEDLRVLEALLGGEQ